MLALPTSAAPPPEADPVFYRWADPIKAQPGVMLRREALERYLVPSGAGVAERILYAATSGWGKARRIATSGKVLLPRGTPPAGGWLVIAWRMARPASLTPARPPSALSRQTT